MRTHGTLVKWNDERGFGFIALPQSHEEVFVHISAFPRDGVRPRVGEMVSFEVRTGADGRKKAEAVERPGGRKASTRQKTTHSGGKGSLVGSLLTAAAVVTIGFVGYNSYVSRQHSYALPLASPATEATTQPSETTRQSFSCDGRTHCSQMTSCAEAEYFLKHCPGVQMDGNGDGEPCEQQWCN